MTECAECSRLLAALEVVQGKLAQEREARNSIARENAARIGAALDTDKQALGEFRPCCSE